MLGSRASAEPAPWRTSRTPYLKDVMDALSAVHPARRVVFMKGAQVADAPLRPSEVPTAGNVAHPSPPSQVEPAPNSERPRGWLAPRSNWLC